MHAEIARQRLINQRIEGERCASPEAVVRWMGAMQAQDYGQALWAIGARLRDATLAEVERAIASGAILRTWPMRGTLHLVAAEDAHWMVALSARRTLDGSKRRRAQLELDDHVIGRAHDLLRAALTGGRRLARPDVMRLWEDGGISTAGQRGYHLLWHSAQAGLICVGPMEGKQQTFALLDEWAPRPRVLSREEGVVELARRYFTSHGPATVRDFAGWSGLTLTEARAGLEGARPSLATERIDGEEYIAPAAAGAVRWVGAAHRMHLLAGFDEYLLGYRERGAVVDAEHFLRVVPGGNGIFLPMVVVDGRVSGIWKRTLKRGTLAVALQPFVPLGDAAADLAQAASRYGAFVGARQTTTSILPPEDAR